MLNYELARVINLARQRDIERAVRERSLRMAALSSQPVVRQPARGPAEESHGTSSLVASRLR
jgi:hypothetical protein